MNFLKFTVSRYLYNLISKISYIEILDDPKNYESLEGDVYLKRTAYREVPQIKHLLASCAFDPHIFDIANVQ